MCRFNRSGDSERNNVSVPQERSCFREDYEFGIGRRFSDDWKTQRSVNTWFVEIRDLQKPYNVTNSNPCDLFEVRIYFFHSNERTFHSKNARFLSFSIIEQPIENET